MMTIKWQDKKPVTIQRTVHANITLVDTGKTSRETREPVKKPIPILDNEEGMVGFDGENGIASCIIHSHVLLSEGV